MGELNYKGFYLPATDASVDCSKKLFLGGGHGRVRSSRGCNRSLSGSPACLRAACAGRDEGGVICSWMTILIRVACRSYTKSGFIYDRHAVYKPFPRRPCGGEVEQGGEVRVNGVEVVELFGGHGVTVVFLFSEIKGVYSEAKTLSRSASRRRLSG